MSTMAVRIPLLVALVVLFASPGLRAQEAPGRPRTVVVTLDDATGHAIGRPDAPITMVEFTDLQCPFCRRFSTTTFERIRKEYVDTGKVRFVTRDMPLAMHPQASRAARSGRAATRRNSAALAVRGCGPPSRCGGEQEKYWEMRATLVKNAAALTPALIDTIARDLGLDMTAFTTCVEGARHVAPIAKDVRDARQVGITGTPSFVIGKTRPSGLEGVRITGAKSFAVFEATFKELLEGVD